MTTSKANSKNKKYNLIIGRHCSFEKPNYLPGAVKEAISYGGNALMIYLGAPQNARRRRPLTELKVSEFQKTLTENNIDINNVIVHGPYVVNLANTFNKETFDFSVKFLKKEIAKMEAIGLKTIVLHPGSALTAQPKDALSQIVEGLNLVLTESSTVRIALETMCGRGSEVGINFDQLKYIIDRTKQKERVGVCWDTCHLYSAGYDIKNNLEAIIKEFDQKIGLDKLWTIHINDSSQALGAKVDRHENIGYGNIGLETLQKIV
jgi:deoxyribonuclease-4